MEVSPVRKTSPRLFWQLKFRRILRNAPQSNFNLLTIQFFLAVPIAFRLPLFFRKNKMNNIPCSTSTSFLLTSYIMDKLRSAENRLSSYRQKLLTILRTEQWMDQVKVLASERPLTSAAVCAAALCAAGPLLAVFLVAATAVIFAFLGFVFIEGTLLTLGTMFVGVTLCVAACIAFPVAAFLGIVYLSMSFVMQLYSSISETLKQLFVTQEEADAAAFAAHQRVRYMSGSLSPTHPLVPSCITDSDAILSRRMAANGHGKHLTCDYYPMGFPVRCMTNNGDSCMSNTAECG